MTLDKAFQNVMKDSQNYFSEEQVNRMLSYCWSNNMDMVWFLILLLWRTGRRITEVLSFKTGDIDHDNSLINFKILKKRKQKDYREWMAIDDDTLLIIKNFINSRYAYDPNKPEGEYIFKSNKPRKDKVTYLYTRKWAFEQICKVTLNCDIKFKKSKQIKEFDRNGTLIVSEPYWHPHHFRHSFAINFLKKANDPSALNILQQQLAHTNINITSTYLKFDQKDRKRLLNKVFGKKNE